MVASKMFWNDKYCSVLKQWIGETLVFNVKMLFLNDASDIQSLYESYYDNIPCVVSYFEL